MLRIAMKNWVLGLVLPATLAALYSCGSSSDSRLTGGGGSCTSNGDCTSGLCLGGVCEAGKAGGSDCSSGTDCVSGVCTAGACVGNGQGAPSGSTCASASDCASGLCTGGECAVGSGLPDGRSCSSAGECASGACTDGICGTGTSGGGGDASAGGSGSGPGTAPDGAPCSANGECASGLCVNGACTGPVPGTYTTGPQWNGSGSGFRPLTAGCGPDTAAECTGTCEQSGGDPNVQIIRPPATLCFTGEGDPTPEDPGVVIEQSIETLNGVSYVHLRVTFDPAFVDNTYGTGSVGWNPRRPHTFVSDLTKSDHTELLLTDATGATVTNFKIDYVSPDSTKSCGFGTLGVTGGDGLVISGDPSKILAISTSAERNLNGCGYCQNAACDGGDCTVNSPATDENFTANPGTPNWDYRVSYEVWIDASAFGGAGFGQAYMTYVHASPSKAGSDTIYVTPSECPKSWSEPYCPPSVIEEGGNCFGSPTGGSGGTSGAGGAGTAGSAGSTASGGSGGGPSTCPVNYQIYISSEGQSTCTPIPFANYPGMTPCPAGYTLDVATEGQYCLPSP